MSDEAKHKESLDRFSSYLRERLRDHPTPVDADGWDAIAKQLKRRKRMRTVWIVTGIAAAALTGILWFSVLQNIPVMPEEMIVQEDLPAAREDRPSTSNVEPVAQEKKIARAEKKDKKALKTVPPAAPETFPAEEENDRENAPEELPADTLDQEKTTPAVQPNDTRKTTVNPSKNDDHPRKKKEIKPAKKRRKGKWLLAAAFGTGGGTPSLSFGRGDDYHMVETPEPPPGEDLNSGEEPDPDPEKETAASSNALPVTKPNPMTRPPEANNGLHDADQYDDITHAIPISVGITVRKDFNEWLALETGLFYTYLSSDLKKKERVRIDQLKLHYLGVPLNLVGYLIKQPRWNLYLSGGVMLEKGLRSIHTQNVYYPDRVATHTQRRAVSGVQVSLNGAIGVSYRFEDHWGLYVEPKLYYYFDTDQPVSVRTERPFGLGINAGIRYHF